MSKSCVILHGSEELCENTVEDIEKELSENGKVTLILSGSGTKLPVAKDFIATYYPTDN